MGLWWVMFPAAAAAAAGPIGKNTALRSGSEFPGGGILWEDACDQTAALVIVW